MHQSRPGYVTVRRRRGFWERWTTRAGVIVLLLGVEGSGVYADVESVPGYAPWQDKASTSLRQWGFGPALDTYDNWFHTRHAPSDTQPDVGGLMTTTTITAAPCPNLPPPLPQRLSPAMVGPSERYVHPDLRDFVYFTTTTRGSSAATK